MISIDIDEPGICWLLGVGFIMYTAKLAETNTDVGWFGLPVGLAMMLTMFTYQRPEAKKTTIDVTKCAACNAPILDGGLCSYQCEYDTLSQRPVYTEQYVLRSTSAVTTKQVTGQ